MVTVEHVTMEYDLNRGKIRSLKERLFAKVEDKVRESRKFLALDDVSFHLDRGETLGVIGNNGAGKSTLLKIVSGIMKPTKGRVQVNGTISPMIELGTGFDMELSAIENIYLSGAVLGYSKKLLAEKQEEIIGFSELADFKDVPVKYYSSGMVARLAFAISTIVMPSVLIVDEILSVGDVPFQKKSFQKMQEMMAGGTTVIYVSHNIDSVKQMCSRCIWLEHGKVQMDGPSAGVCESFMECVSNG
ncbi:MAG: ABC transporter ATP-binding protein [Acidaminococcaceae bacterium]|nr:ABC transporter ATP-binding protein [Acidaminococcaceae bacterium]